MQRPRAVLLLVGATLATTSALSGAAHAQSEIDISMAEAPATPRLQGPFVYGAAPSSPFLFAIPATGRAPLEFSVSGLPAGLTLAPSTGIISGTTPAAGSYPVRVTVTNAAGTASATYTLQSGSTLALTPPMGWNSYDSFGASVTEQDMIEQGQAVRTYLQPYGWNTVVIDYRWYEPGQPIDANGRYVPAKDKHPSATGSNGFKSLADRIHAMGLGFGIHIMRGVPRKSYNANLPIAGSSYTTRDAGNPDDPCPWDEHMWGVRGDTPAGQAWYDALFQQYASWGVDFVKIDDMLNNSTRKYHQAEADAIHRAVEKTGRSIMLSFSPGPNDPSWLIASSGHLNGSANMWRVVNDFWDYNALTDLPGVLRAASTWQGVNGLTPGHWPDLDMLPLGYLGPRNEWHASGQTRFTKNEQVTIMSLWTMLPSPLMFGGNPARLGSDAWTLALLTNEEVLAVNQDALGARGRRTTVNGGELWVRDLSGDRKAVAFFNHGDQDMTMSVSFSQLGVTGTPVIRDLWRRADVSGMSDALSANVPAGAALIYTLSPPGGMGEVSSAAATSGSSGGGSTSEGGAGGGGGGTGGGGGGTGGGGGAGTAGVGAGGAGSGGEAGAAGSTGDEPSGCGCTVPGHRRTPAALLLLLATTAIGALRRRAARR
ncbi:putative Ig domain-containing protein [Sorangium sp. So ce1000]|uniref:putative Ig domain-containing protein n=1 Tax=Sorangium sp. So ce1000 TaxID=3133325 RepID=UPI003F63FA19